MLQHAALAGAVLVVTTGGASAQSLVRPVPRVATHELASIALAPDLGSGPGSRWALEAPTERAGAVDLALVGRVSIQPDADLSDAPGQVATQRAGWDVIVGRRSDSGGLLAIGLESEASFYDFGNAAGFVAGAPDPFNDLYATRLGATLYSPLDADLDLFGGIELTVAGEDEVDLSSGLTLGASTGFAYRADDTLELSVGLAGASRLEDDAYVLPFLGIDWRLAEGTRLVAEGPELRLEQRLGNALELTLRANYDQRQFRLNDAGALAGGAFRDEQIDLGATLAWRPTDRVRVAVSGGYTVWRELTFLADGGGVVASSEVDPAPFGALTVSLTF